MFGRARRNTPTIAVVPIVKSYISIPVGASKPRKAGAKPHEPMRQKSMGVGAISFLTMFIAESRCNLPSVLTRVKHKQRLTKIAVRKVAKGE